MNASKSKPFLVTLALCLFLTAVAFASYGFPANLYTWVWFGIALSLCLLVRTYGWRCISFPLLFFVPVLIPYESHNTIDIRTGQRRIELRPGMFRFGQRYGCNTLLIEKYLGPLEPEWQHGSIGSLYFGLGRWRDGNNRTHSRSMLFQPYLSNVLEKLPDDTARKKVLNCITDSANLLKFHQEIILTTLEDRGYPKEHNAQSWWAKHGRLFEPEIDPNKAEETAGGWIKRVRQYSEHSSEVWRLIQVAEMWQGVYFPSSDKGLYNSVDGIDDIDWWEPDNGSGE